MILAGRFCQFRFFAVNIHPACRSMPGLALAKSGLKHPGQRAHRTTQVFVCKKGMNGGLDPPYTVRNAGQRSVRLTLYLRHRNQCRISNKESRISNVITLHFVIRHSLFNIQSSKSVNASAIRRAPCQLCIDVCHWLCQWASS